jgi:hypothetical protein
MVSASTTANSLGLVLDIIGALLVWKFGLPAHISRTGAIYIIAEQTDEVEAALAKKFDRWAKVGLLCLALGFGFQLLSNFI